MYEHTLEKFLKWLHLKIVRFISEKKIWVGKRLEGSKNRENRMCLKICHINSLRLKTCVFHGLLAKNASKAQNFSWIDFTRETVARESWKSLSEFCVFMFCLNPFSWEELSRELLVKMPLKKFLKKNMKNAIWTKT